MAEEPTYRIEVYNEFWGALERQPPAQQDRITQFMAQHFTVRLRVMIPSQLKKLKSTHSHLYQLDCGRDRLLYEVDEFDQDRSNCVPGSSSGMGEARQDAGPVTCYFARHTRQPQPRPQPLYHLPIASDDALLQRISSNPERGGGRPCIRDTRIRVVDILNMLGGGMNEAEILADYPQLVEADVRAALVFAARQFAHPVLSA